MNWGHLTNPVSGQARVCRYGRPTPLPTFQQDGIAGACTGGVDLDEALQQSTTLGQPGP